MYGIDDQTANNAAAYDDAPDTCPNGIAKGGFGASAGKDEKNVFVPGLCAMEPFAEFQSTQVFGDPCVDRGFCDWWHFMVGRSVSDGWWWW